MGVQLRPFRASDALRLPTREHTKSLLLLLKTSSSKTKKQERQEDEGGHVDPLALGGCSGPFSDGADDGGVGDLEDRAREDLRRAQFARLHRELRRRAQQVHTDRTFQDEDLDGEQGQDREAQQARPQRSQELPPCHEPVRRPAAPGPRCRSAGPSTCPPPTSPPCLRTWTGGSMGR